jgi:hypothetical protein
MVLIPDYDSDPYNILFQDPVYSKAGEERLADYEAGEWNYVYVVARAEIRIPSSEQNRDSWIITTIDSPGLWGVESDSGDRYFAEIFQQEKATLQDMLSALRDYEIVGE